VSPGTAVRMHFLIGEKDMRSRAMLAVAAFSVCLFSVVACRAVTAQPPVLLYDQDFENPVAFNDDGDNVNSTNTVNQLYGNQPVGFEFAQTFTVETLLVTGSAAFGTGYSDPSGTGGNYTLGMLSTAQDDWLGLSFDVGDNDFLVLRMDISSIDLSAFGGPFVASGAVPVFEYSLYDNPGGGVGLGNGTPLATGQATGTTSDRDTFDWTAVQVPLDATGVTDGNVILRVDLLEGGYAALDNFLVFASETPDVPEPSTCVLLATGGLVGLLWLRRKQTFC